MLRAAVDLVATTRGRLWVAPEQDLATHVEPGHLSPSSDWAQVLRLDEGAERD